MATIAPERAHTTPPAPPTAEPTTDERLEHLEAQVNRLTRLLSCLLDTADLT